MTFVEPRSPMNDGLPTDEYSNLTGSWEWHGYECKGADEATFVPRNNLWATDKKGLFKQNTRVRVKDPSSCQVLNLLFAKDGEQVYYIMGISKAVEDVESFEVLDCGQYFTADGTQRLYSYARDCRNVYCHEYSSGAPKVLKGADLGTFTRLEYGFAKDYKHVWVTGNRIKMANPATFTVIDDLYSKDDKHAFYDETVLDDANPQSFRPVARTMAVDSNCVYFQRNRIVGADAQSFQPLGDSWYSRDKHAVYYMNEPVQGADPDTFEVEAHTWGRARDKDHQYERGKAIA
jgi:hypothetical protein